VVRTRLVEPRTPQLASRRTTPAQNTPRVVRLEEPRARPVPRTRLVVARTRLVAVRERLVEPRTRLVVARKRLVVVLVVPRAQLVVPRTQLEPQASPLEMVPLERQQVLVPHKKQQAQRWRRSAEEELAQRTMMLVPLELASTHQRCSRSWCSRHPAQRSNRLLCDS